MKFNPLPEIVSGKRVVVVDDSIVRGNTTRQIVGHAPRRRGQGGPPADLGAADPRPLPLRGGHVQERGDDRPRPRGARGGRRGRGRLAGLPLLDGVYEAVGTPREQHCDACFSGDYPLGDAARATASSPEELPVAAPRLARRSAPGRPSRSRWHRPGTDALQQLGHAGFRPGQREAAEAATASRDVLLVMPRAPASRRLPAPGAAGRHARRRRLAARLADGRPGAQPRRTRRADQRPARPGPTNRQALERALAGDVELLYVAPERFWTPEFVIRLREARARPVRRRRGPLLQPLGPRLPARLLPPGGCAREARRCALSSPRRPPRRRGSRARSSSGWGCGTRFGSPPASTGRTSLRVVAVSSARAKQAATMALLREHVQCRRSSTRARARRPTRRRAALARARRNRCRPITRAWTASRAPRPSAGSCRARRRRGRHKRVRDGH